MITILLIVSLIAWTVIGVLLIKQIGGKADKFLASLAIAGAFGIWVGSLLLTIS